MTTKTLTSNYPDGYVLNATYSKLVIDLGVTVGASESAIGVYSGHTAAIANYGTVTGGTSFDGVDLKAGGSVTNGSTSDTTALIAGSVGVVFWPGSSTTLTNFGTIFGRAGVGVDLGSNGNVTNGSAADATARIEGTIGVYSDGSAVTTVTNFGTIEGVGGPAVEFHSAADRLIAEKSAVFGGELVGGDGTLELAGGSDTITGLGGAGTITGATSANFSGFGTYVVDAGAGLTLTGTNTLTTGQSLTVAGSLVNNGTLSGPATRGYGVTLAGGKLTNGSATDTTALIYGHPSGVYAAVGATVTIGNFGTIQSSSAVNSVGVNLDANGAVTNGSAADKIALIKGGFGVYSYGSAATTVTNFGTIDGTGGTAVAFHAAADRLIVEKSAVFVGALAGGDGTLELAGGTGTITGLGGAGTMTGATSASFSGFGSYLVDAAAGLTLTGTNALTTGQSLRSAGTLINTGTLTGPATHGYGVTLAGGTLTNGSATDTTALIAGDSSGVYAAVGATVTIGNFGTIQAYASNSVGVNLDANGNVTNGSAADTTALIKGAFGVYSFGSAVTTVTNFGTITGPFGAAVEFHSAADRLIVEKSAVFVGSLAGGGGTLELAGGSDTITGLGGAAAMTGATSAGFAGFGSYVVDAGADLTLTGTNALANGQSLTVAGSLTNTGTLTEVNTGFGYGVTLLGGTLTNGSVTDTTALISADRDGVYATVGPTVTIANFGTIEASDSNSAGVLLGDADGNVTNGSAADTTALIKGDFGVYATAGLTVTVTNFGTIDGTGGTSVDFMSASDRLIAEAGSHFTGAVAGGGGTLELAGGTGTITGLGATGTLSVGASGTFSGFGAYQIDAGSKWTLPGASAIGVGQTLDNAGTISINGSDAALTVSGVLVNSGTIDINGATGADAGLIFSGDEILSGGGVVDLGSFGSLAGYGPTSLTNLNNTITGAGSIFGSFALTNASAGVIDATGRMGFHTLGETAVNNGLVESTGSGLLDLETTTLNDTGGGQVIDGRRLWLDGSTIDGGSLTVESTGTLQSAAKAGTIDLGTGTVVNDGVIIGWAAGLTIDGALDNARIAEAWNSDLTVTGAVTGAGFLRVTGTGKLFLDGADAEKVEFTKGSTGELVLGDALAFTGHILGFSLTGANSIDLADGAWNSLDTATFKAGAGNDGVLTIADGSTVLATLDLTGDYKSSTFTLSNDGSGGVLIKDPPKTAALAQAMAGFGGSHASSAPTATIATTQPPPLASPHGG